MRGSPDRFACPPAANRSEILATAQRRKPAEVRALFVEEVAGRGRLALASRRAAAGFPTGKTSEPWDESASAIPPPTHAALCTWECVRRPKNLGGLWALGHGQDLPARSGADRSRLNQPAARACARGGARNHGNMRPHTAGTRSWAIRL